MHRTLRVKAVLVSNLIMNIKEYIWSKGWMPMLFLILVLFYCVSLNSVTFCNCRCRCCFMLHLYEKSVVRSKKCFTYHRTAKTFKLDVAIKKKFSGLFFFWTICREGELPRHKLIDLATCLFKSRRHFRIIK